MVAQYHTIRAPLLWGLVSLDGNLEPKGDKGTSGLPSSQLGLPSSQLGHRLIRLRAGLELRRVSWNPF